MYSTGHYGVSLILFAPLLAGLIILGLPMLGVLSLIVVLYTAPLPDIDIKPPLRYFIAHRTWTHSIWFAGLVGLLTGGLFSLLDPMFETFGVVTLFAYGAFIGAFGIFAHLAGDLLTHTGVPFFYPRGRRYGGFGLTSAKGLWWFENPKSGNQNELTFFEGFRHRILNSNRIFLILGMVATGLAFIPYALSIHS